MDSIAQYRMVFRRHDIAPAVEYSDRERGVIRTCIVAVRINSDVYQIALIGLVSNVADMIGDNIGHLPTRDSIEVSYLIDARRLVQRVVLCR